MHSQFSPSSSHLSQALSPSSSHLPAHSMPSPSQPTPSPSLLTTILPLFNLTKCLSSFTGLSFTSSPPANDTEGHHRNTNRHRRNTNPLPDIGIASMSQPILGVAVESETLIWVFFFFGLSLDLG